MVAKLAPLLREELTALRALPADRHRKLMVITLPANFLGTAAVAAILIKIAHLDCPLPTGLAYLAASFPLLVGVGMMPIAVATAFMRRSALISGHPSEMVTSCAE